MPLLYVAPVLRERPDFEFRHGGDHHRGAVPRIHGGRVHDRGRLLVSARRDRRGLPRGAGESLASLLFRVFSLGVIFSLAMVGLAASILYSTSDVLPTTGPTQYVAASLSLFAAVAAALLLCPANLIFRLQGKGLSHRGVSRVPVRV